MAERVHSDELWGLLKAAGVLPQDGSGIRRIEIVAEVGQPVRMLVDAYAGGEDKNLYVRTLHEFVDGKTAVEPKL